MDNIDIPDAASVTRAVATDDVAGVHYQLIKIAHGVDGVADAVTISAPLPTELVAALAGYIPGYDQSGVAQRLNVDPDGLLNARAAILTDEGTFRVNFANASLAVAVGSPTRVGDVITGITVGADIHVGDYFRFDSDVAESAWLPVTAILSETVIEVAGYAGATSGAASRALVRPFTGTAGSLTVGSGQLTINSGATSGSNTGVERIVDYAPLVFRSRLSLSQRIANQEAIAGLQETRTGGRWFARFRFTGTTNTQVICETGRNPSTTPSASETQTTTVNISATSALNDYRVELMTETVRFYVGGNLVAEHTTVIPSQHDEMIAVCYWNNTGTPAGSSAIVADYVTGKNHNKAEIGVFSDAEQIGVRAAAGPVVTFTATGVITINTNLVLIDCTQYQGISVHCHSIGTTGVITPEWSADGTNWTTATVSTVAGATATTLAATTNYLFQRAAKFFRLRLSTATTALTTTVHVQGLPFPPDTFLATQPVSGTVTATVTSTRITPNAADGHSSTHHLISTTGTNATSARNAAAAIGLITVSNNNAAARYFKLFNKASAPTVGTDTPVMTVFLPPNSTTVIGGNSPLRLSTGIAYALTTGIAIADTAGVGASEHAVSIFYT